MRQWWKEHGRKWAFRLCGLALTAAVAVSLLPETVVVPASAVTQAEIDAMKEEANSLKQQQEEIQDQLDSLAADRENAMARKTLLEQQINATRAEINTIAAQIAKYDELIAQKQEELSQAEAEEQAQYELFCERVRYMEEQGEVSYWSILFSSKDFADLLDNAMMVEEIMDYDNQVMDQLIALREQIEEDKAELETARQEQQDAKAEQEAAQANLQAQESEVDALLSQISNQEDELEAREAQLRAASDAATAEIAAAERELAAQIANVPSESGFLWPLPGRYNLSSLFGSRKHPITGKANNHTGIDIPASSGTSILAAKSGVVTTSTYNNSYGNYVVVSHSDGTSTLYAHMVRRNCSKGDTVSQGQVIGYVGTTGSSTGNHLHFEVRVNGSRVDPINYFTDLPLTISGVSLF
ncbi:murein hydrolase activator EnvC family protein [Pseudoflavonifractor capillosus]|uniref:murein hydrolase activator EnvC family protein n=1 Tax=Pseudoflavonifractor capillosus TaxID=106588 RepID=UPI00195A0DC3|nr:M23 family metallopeptidase [Pseudoflavonifractor capillosus]MBM6680285.1 peptidoglycan DD-metalloendopeptidase family protein [Pseudoflavonifractor capillosus]